MITFEERGNIMSCFGRGGEETENIGRARRESKRWLPETYGGEDFVVGGKMVTLRTPSLTVLTHAL